MKKFYFIWFIPIISLFAFSDYQKEILPALEPTTINCYKECKASNELATCDEAIDELEVHTRKMFDDAEKDRVDKSHASYSVILDIMEPVCPKERERFIQTFPH